MPSVEGIQEYIETAENYVYTSFVSVTEEMPMISEALHRLWVDVSRFGPSIPDLHIPGLGDFEVPPPPPPPPPPRTLLDKSADWIAEHPWSASSIGVGVVGIGLLVGYSTFHARSTARRRMLKSTSTNERRQVVVVLGGDTPLALPLILDLEKNKFVVIASVTTPEAADELEQKCGGYVRALVLDPSQPATVPIFLRSLASAMSRRFPINAPGDPHASPASHLHIHSIISLLSLWSPISPPSAPLEHLHLHSDYLPYLTATHITPLQVIQALLPLMRTSPARTRDASANGKGKKSIVVCVPAADARVGLPFAGARAMSAAATLRAVEVLRREIRIAALTGSAESMRDMNIVAIDVGAVDTPVIHRRRLLMHDTRQDMASWTASEKLAYGPAFEATLEEGHTYAIQRRPSDVRVFVDNVVDVVRYGHMRSVSFFGFSVSLGPLLKWTRGGRYTLGAGAMTYAAASHLPISLLDVLLNIPHFLISARNAFIPVPPRVPGPGFSPIPPPAPAPAEAPAPAAATAPTPTSTAHIPEVPVKPQDVDSAPASDHEHDASETGSEADIESNEGDGSGVGDSWVSLKPKPTM
ncbi:hypothetical protein BV25DRAFT_428639 [Artomyces pyxidatus]|uniref:Uncharacterized protein n=1 Tax=Artomyces pyxidatus TaxID=48021 RepID=A0ACB8T4U0_9AGAM|nr:hypothetical protein BV25DRAFT_428639 [Artomyces pyxidatus]